MTDRSKLLMVLTLSADLTAIATVLLLAFLGGASEAGVRCERSGAAAGCQVRRSRFLGVAGNSAFTIPESAIEGAVSRCGAPRVGGRGGPNCGVYLVAGGASGQSYPVLSYALAGQAEAAAARLDRYFQDPTAASIEIRPDLMTPLFLFGAVPILLVVGAVLGLRRWSGRRKSEPASA